MPGLTRTYRKKLLDHLFNKAALVAPTIYVGLSTTLPASDGSNITEPADAGYARKATAAADWNASTAADPCEVNNANAITMDQAQEDWNGGANIGYFFLVDAAADGTVIGGGPLDQAKPFLNNDIPQFAAGSLRARLNWTA